MKSRKYLYRPLIPFIAIVRWVISKKDKGQKKGNRKIQYKQSKILLFYKIQSFEPFLFDHPNQINKIVVINEKKYVYKLMK